MQTYRVRARNTALDSENRIHEDRTAAAYGFRGGLVPGVTVYGYLTVPVVEHFGADWLGRGGMRVRFQQPVYADDEVVVELEGNQIEARQADGTLCASGEIFWPDGEAPSPAFYPEAPLPAERPAASERSLATGRILGSLHRELRLPDEAFLNPEALLSLSNQLLMENVKLGPWIHAASEVRNFSLAKDGEHITVRGRVAERLERKGHQFVVLDIIVVAEGARVVQQVRHTAIYEPRLTPR